MLQISDSDLQDLHCKTLVVPSAWECHANGKQGDLSKLQVQVLNGKVARVNQGPAEHCPSETLDDSDVDSQLI